MRTVLVSSVPMCNLKWESREVYRNGTRLENVLNNLLYPAGITTQLI